MTASATQSQDQRHCRYCNEVVVNARPLDQLQKKHDKITCSKCQAERKRKAFYDRLGYTPEEKKVLKNPKAPVIKEGYSECLCSKCGSYRELRERKGRLVAVCTPCQSRRANERKLKTHELGLVTPIEEARKQKAAAVFGENHCNKCGSLKTAKIYNTKKGVRNTSVCMECKKLRDREHSRNRTPEKNSEVCAKYRNSDKFLERIRIKKELSLNGRNCKLALWSCIDCGIKKCKRASDRKSDRCKPCSHKINSIRNIKPLKELKCKSCGVVFYNRLNLRNCDTCIAEYKHWKEGRAKQRGKAYSYFGRAKLAGSPYEVVVRNKVYERDSYTCYLCGVKVVKSKTYTPYWATIDHVIPLSKGGGHTYSNIKTCCFRCNSVKSDNIYDTT